MSTILLWNILLYCTHESHNIVWWLLTYADNNVCWLTYWYEIFYDIVPMKATILSADYWRILTILSVEYYCYEIFYYIVHSCMPQYCLLTTERMLTIMSVEYYIAMKYFTISFIHVSHNIVCWLLTYADNNVCWVLYIAMKYLLYCTHESHNIVWRLLTYADNIVCWVLLLLNILFLTH